MTSLNLYEAYAAVYDDNLREELLTEEIILLESIEELYDDELEEIVEDSIYSMLDEGYDIDEVEEIFEEVFSEARVDMAARAAQRKADTEASEKSATEARSRGASVVRKEKRAEAIGRIKGRIKGAVKTAMTNVRNVVDKPARNYAADRGLIASKSGKTKLGTGEKGQSGILQKQTTSAGRREVRGAVVKDLTSRAQEKLGRGVDAAKSAGSAVKKGAKGLLGGIARAVSRGSRNVARRLGEDVDLYDVVLEHLLDEGYADTEESALVIMANMSEEWRESILSEDPVQDYRDMKRADENRGGARGPELSHNTTPGLKGKPQPGRGSVTQKPTVRGREFTNPPS